MNNQKIPLTLTPLKVIPVPIKKQDNSNQIIEKKSQVSWKPTLSQRGGCYMFEFGSYEKGKDIYAFDLDDTLIKTESGKAFAQNKDDWQFWSAEVKPIIQKLLENGSYIIIISNQKGISSGKTLLSDIESKITSVILELCDQKREWCNRFGVYVAGYDDRYRKPHTTIWKLLTPEQQDSVKYFCGDAAGRSQDHGPTDRYFAENCSIPFRTPEEVFENINYTYKAEPYPAHAYIESSSYSADTYGKNFELLLKQISLHPKLLVVMVGSQASGKSSLSRALVKALNEKQQDCSVHVEKDALRGVQKRFMSIIDSHLSSKKYVIADATHPNSESRKEVINLATSKQIEYLCVHVDLPLQLSLHMDACRVELELSEAPIALVAFRTFYKKFREDIGKEAEKQSGHWFSFTGVNPLLIALPEYRFKYS